MSTSASAGTPLLACAILATSMALVSSCVGLSKLLVFAIPVFLLAWLRFGIAAPACGSSRRCGSFLLDLVRSRLHEIAGRARLPGSSMILSSHALRCGLEPGLRLIAFDPFQVYL